MLAHNQKEELEAEMNGMFDKHGTISKKDYGKVSKLKEKIAEIVAEMESNFAALAELDENQANKMKQDYMQRDQIEDVFFNFVSSYLSYMTR